ncbi:helix-turn-helix domain-containing protein [Bradyrhizobium sp. RDM4]|uniref:helix-turn-helix domain-containing protein n=1 Tax=Bradyrhizobium sp. RDM4 TaxID=3378765 RepID=UPI0038FCB82B
MSVTKTSTATNLNTTRAAFMRRASAPDINALALKLAYLIAFKFMDSATGTARPSQDTLARDLAVSVRTVQRLLDILQPLGLVIVPGHGPGRAATYWIDADKATPVSPLNTTPVSPIGGRKGDIRRPNTRHQTTKYTTPVSPPLKKNLQEEEPRKEESESPALDVAAPDSKGDARSEPDRKTGQVPKGDNITISDPASETLDTKKTGVNNFAPTFSDFLAVYPKRVAVAQGEKAWLAKIKAGVDPTEMIAGAKRYGIARIAEEPTDERKRWKYTKDPATWINGECWRDEASPVAGVTIDQAGNVIAPPPRPSGPQSIVDVANKIRAERAARRGQ